MKLSFHVCNMLCAEEVYAGMQAHFDAYFVEIPDEFFPKGLLDAVKNHGRIDPQNGSQRYVTNIAIHGQEYDKV